MGPQANLIQKPPLAYRMHNRSLPRFSTRHVWFDRTGIPGKCMAIKSPQKSSWMTQTALVQRYKGYGQFHDLIFHEYVYVIAKLADCADTGEFWSKMLVDSHIL